MSLPDNPSAFPLSREQEDWYQSGMSLRDWFAGQAIGHLTAIHSSPSFIAKVAYDVADAMLAARLSHFTNDKEGGE